MAPTLGNKRSIPRIISPPFPTASSTMVFETAGEGRWSGESVSDTGYSALFTSGMLHQHMHRSVSPTDLTGPEIIRGPFHPSPEKASPTHLSPPNLSPMKTTCRRRRSSIIHSTSSSASPRAFKSGGMDNGVERALDNVMKSLKVMAMGTPLKSPRREESRWSLSSEESVATEESGFWRPRKSEESTRSRITVGTMRSNRSKKSRKSRKSRKSEDTERMDLDMEEDIPPVPVPTTPGRRKRMMEGLVKRLGLTPKKKLASAPEMDEPTNPRVPRKSSFSTLRSAITKKTSTGTLRSIRSTKSSHPFMGCGTTIDCEAFPPPLPRWTDGEHGDGCLPSTPKRRTPKSSIGQPRLQPSTSPTMFMKEPPRRAPGTPKDTAPDLPPMPDILDELGYDFKLVQQATPPHIGSTSISLQDKLRRAEAVMREATPELSPEGRKAFECDTPRSEISTGLHTPVSNIDTPEHGAEAAVSFETPPLTARAANDALKPKRLVNLLPKQQRANLGLQTPPSTGLRQKKSATFRAPLGERTNAPARLGAVTPDSIASVLAKANTSRHPFAASKPYTPSPVMLKPKQAWAGPPAQNRRDPLGIIGRFEAKTASSNPSPDLPYCAGGGDGWNTPALDIGSKSYFDDTFPASNSHSYTHPYAGSASKTGPPMPDFTASPDISFSSISAPSFRRRDSNASMDSDLPTEEWELEAYLKELDRVDQERAQMGQGEVGVGR